MDEQATIIAKLMLGDGMVKLNLAIGSSKHLSGRLWQGLDGKTQLVRECTTEVERVHALKEMFDITLTEEEVQGIKGTITELKG